MHNNGIRRPAPRPHLHLVGGSINHEMKNTYLLRKETIGISEDLSLWVPKEGRLRCLWPERIHNLGNDVTVSGANKPSTSTDVPSTVLCPAWRYQTLRMCTSPHRHTTAHGQGSRPVPCTTHRRPALTMNVWVMQQMFLQILKDFLDLAPGHITVTCSLRPNVASF